MKIIQVYDPPMGCSVGAYGTGIDPDRIHFVGVLSELRTRGIKIERYNLAQQPAAFAENPVVKALMVQMDTEALPVILWDGAIQLTGRYPTKDERLEWFHAACTRKLAVAA